jgi:serine/threonine protein kinase
MVKILTEPIRWQTKVKLSNHGLDFLKKLLEHDLKKRMTASEALEHPWMRQADDTGSLPTEVVRSAHKKVTATKKTVDPKVEDLRNQKLNRIDEDFKNNIRYGKRLGDTPTELNFMHKPEFQRHQNKTVTAPSTQMVDRRSSLNKMLDKVAEGGHEETAEGEHHDPERKSHRSVSVTGPPRRLSYIGALTCNEEKNLASLYAEKTAATSTPKLGVVPEPHSKEEVSQHAEGKEAATAAAGLSNTLDKAEAAETK